MIRNVTEKDTQAIANIYNYYVQNTSTTFEEDVLTADDFLDRIRKVQNANLSWLVAEVDGKVIGYTYSTKWKERTSYKYTAEVSVYLLNNIISKGWGTKLYHALFNELKMKSIHVVIATIALPNPISVALNEKFGMEKVAHFSEVGYKFGKWIDVGYWQVQLMSG